MFKRRRTQTGSPSLSEQKTLVMHTELLGIVCLRRLFLGQVGPQQTSGGMKWERSLSSPTPSYQRQAQGLGGNPASRTPPSKNEPSEPERDAVASRAGGGGGTAPPVISTGAGSASPASQPTGPVDSSSRVWEEEERPLG